jgi:hypothetical protein
MSKVKFKCYLCGEEAEKYPAPDNPRDEIVECSHCVNKYQVRQRALKFYLDRKQGDEVLTKEDRYKLHEHVFEQVIIIDTDTIEKVTGKRSVGYR